MNQIIGIAGPLLAGLGLGAVYFGGLWYTLRRMRTSPRPGLLIFSSYFGRIAVCATGFYLIGWGGHWERMVIALAGVLIARMLLVRRWGEQGWTGPNPVARHADS